MSGGLAEILDNETGKVTGPRGAKAFKKWEPKKWLPIYEAIVALSCTGLSNEDVGKRFGYGKQQVSNILNTIQGKKLVEIITERLRAANAITFEQRLDALKETALKNIESVLSNEKVLEKAPLAMLDRSLSILKSTGVVSKDKEMGTPLPSIGNQTNIQNNVTMLLNAENRNTLSEGLLKAKEAREINADFQLPATAGK